MTEATGLTISFFITSALQALLPPDDTVPTAAEPLQLMSWPGHVCWQVHVGEGAEDSRTPTLIVATEAFSHFSLLMPVLGPLTWTTLREHLLARWMEELRCLEEVTPAAQAASGSLWQRLVFDPIQVAQWWGSDARLLAAQEQLFAEVRQVHREEQLPVMDDRWAFEQAFSWNNQSGSPSAPLARMEQLVWARGDDILGR